VKNLKFIKIEIFGPKSPPGYRVNLILMTFRTLLTRPKRLCHGNKKDRSGGTKVWISRSWRLVTDVSQCPFLPEPVRRTCVRAWDQTIFFSFLVWCELHRKFLWCEVIRTVQPEIIAQNFQGHSSSGARLIVFRIFPTTVTVFSDLPREKRFCYTNKIIR